jgi:transglutaminase-like putative cysteine protease
MLSAQLQEFAQNHYQSREAVYGPLWQDIESALSNCTEDEAVLMRYLYGTMPVRDAGEYDFLVFLSYVQHSLWLRANIPWCRELAEEIFIHHVLYYRINTEGISDCRRFFYEQLKDRIQGLDTEQAAIEINYWCAEHVVYESTDGRTVSPITLFRCGKGRCGEESTFTVTAFRSVGIPARQMYTPRWAHCDDNHAWVEVYLQGKWHFLGACEPEEALNRGWFTAPANRAILIHSRMFSDFGLSSTEESIGREGKVCYTNHTAHYALTGELAVTVRDEHGHPVSGAAVAVEILNMAEYYPAATMTTDDLGMARMAIGLGDVRIRAWKDGAFAEQQAFPTTTDASGFPSTSGGAVAAAAMVVLTLRRAADDPLWPIDRWELATLRAPREHLLYPDEVNAEQAVRKVQRLQVAVQIREQRFAALYDQQLAAMYPEVADLICVAGENIGELRAFLTRNDNPNRRRLLCSLAIKDGKDLRSEILEDHLSCEQGSLPSEIYEQYLLCPRIQLEELTPYRRYIRQYFSQEQQNRFAQDPDQIWQYIVDTIDYDSEADYPTICATPIGCLKLRQGNPFAQRILFVAICRSLNIPARLNPVTQAPEYWRDGVFVLPTDFGAGAEVKSGAPRKPGVCVEAPVDPRGVDRALLGQGEVLCEGGPATLILQVTDASEWKYGQTWTIGKLDGVHFDTLSFADSSFEQGILEMRLEPGIYRLITTRRLPSGDQLVAQREFWLAGGLRKMIELLLAQAAEANLLVNRQLSDFLLQVVSGEQAMLSRLVNEPLTMLTFLGVGEEPTEHVLNELIAAASHWNETNARMLLVLRDPAELSNATLRKVLETLSGMEVYLDSQQACAGAAADMGVDGARLPILILLSGELTGIYACAGYNVGSVELLLRLREQHKSRANSSSA